MGVLTQQSVINDLVLPYEPGPTEQRVALRFRLFLVRCLFTAISVLIMLGLWAYNVRVRGVTDYFDAPIVRAMYIGYGAITVITLGTALGRWLFERRRLKRITGRAPTACAVTRQGVQLGDVQLSWANVESFTVNTPWWSKLGRYELLGGGSRARLLADQLPVTVATVANAVQVFSADEVRLNTRKLDR